MKIVRYPHDHETIKLPVTLAGKKIIFLPKGAEVIDNKDHDVMHMDWVVSECVKHPFVLDLTEFKGEE